MSDDHPAQERNAIGFANAAPTKNFFVNMLTRDIELPDALLDLLDNCVDGILRVKGQAEGPTPYKGFRASITMAPDHFIIEDNCGGIPKEVAEQYAFSMGRPVGEEVDRLAASATVGMYGIGMKRAIFKLGTEAMVESNHDEPFSVEFTPEWMSDREWGNLPMYELTREQMPEQGTRVTVFKLHDEASKAFGSSNWIKDFRNTISRHFAIIIAKGFEVRLGSPAEIERGIDPIPGADFQLLETDPLEDGSRIQPYVYVGKIDGVEIEIYAGLYRQLPTEEEAEREEQTRGMKDDAGWTVACNDRVVIWKDTTRLTGWGEATVPNYHGQFIAITGLVLMRSDDPKKLPLTTTKRGIDASSNVYSEAKDLMREATKSLTSFTYRWKKHERQLDTIYQNSRYVGLSALKAAAPAVATTTVRKMAEMRRSVPSLPAPKNDTTTTRVSFAAEKADVEFLARHFFEGQKVKPGEVGEAAFEDVLGRVRG